MRTPDNSPPTLPLRSAVLNPPSPRRVLDGFRGNLLDPAEQPYIEPVIPLCEVEDSAAEKALRCAELGLSATRSPKQVTEALLHAARVAGILLRDFQSSEPEVIVAALLHDVLAEGSTEVE